VCVVCAVCVSCADLCVCGQTLLQAVMLGLQAAVDRVRLPTAYLSLSENATQLAMSQFWNAVKVRSRVRVRVRACAVCVCDRRC
jgi:hypothetical protein